MTKWIKEHEKIALIYDDKSWSYKELIDSALNLQLQTITVNRVIVCTDTDPLTQLLHMLKGLLKDLPVCFGDEEAVKRIEDQTIPNQSFLIATSSGTTGRKKWIYKRKSQWLDSFDPHGHFFHIQESDTLFINGSLSYTANLYSALHMLYSGGTVILSSDKNPRKWLGIMEEQKVTIAFLVPSKLGLLLKAVADKWLHKIAITTAGEPLQAYMIDAVLNKCPNMKLHHYYGAAEVGHISGILHDALLKHPNSVGRAFTGVELLIKDGVIYAKSPYGQKLGEGYESAYDYGVIDDEGYLRVTGRTDTQINVHGRKFDALEVVERLKKVPEVLECLFIQLDASNRDYSLYILIDELSKGYIEKKIHLLLTEDLPRWQWPKSYKIVTKGIYSDTGKYDMVRIRGLFP